MEKILISNGKPLIQDGAVLVFGKDNDDFQIPTVSNIKLSDKGLLTYDFVDIKKFEQFVPEVKYLINVNDNIITTESNEYFVRQYLLDGENKISVATILTLTHSDGRKTYHYSKPAVELITLDTKLIHGTRNIAIASLNNKAYLMGGSQTGASSSSASSSIYVFDATTKTISIAGGSSSWISLPYTMYGGFGIGFNNKVYLFGGYNKSNNKSMDTIIECDFDARKTTTLDTKLGYQIYEGYAYVENDKIYVLGKSYDSIIWLLFDPVAKTIEKLTDRLHQFENGGFNQIHYARFNNKIYFFTSWHYKDSVVVEYDFENNIYTKLDLQFNFYDSTIVNSESGAYVFKGNVLYTFDGNQIKLIDADLTQSITSKLAYATIGEKAYIFGGGTENKSIYELTY